MPRRRRNPTTRRKPPRGGHEAQSLHWYQVDLKVHYHMATHAAFAKLSAGAVSSAFGRTTSSRVATMFGSADPKVERMLRGAMVAAAARFGSKHQAEIRSVLSDDAAFTGRRDALKKALLGVGQPPLELCIACFFSRDSFFVVRTLTSRNFHYNAGSSAFTRFRSICC